MSDKLQLVALIALTPNDKLKFVGHSDFVGHSLTITL
jgi:hypothetical protein